MEILFISKNVFEKHMLLVVFFLSSFFGNAQDFSPNKETTPKTKTYKQAINFCPLAIAFGIYSINYELLLNNHNGILIRADYESVPKNYSAADINVSGKAGIINYRYHIKGGLNSFFVGAFSRYRIYSGEGNLNNTPFNFDLKECTIGANFGKRWIFKNGLNINLVWGYGFFMDHLKQDNLDNDILKSINTFQNQYGLYNGMYGEFSIGFAF